MESLPSLGGATEWLGSEPLAPAELRGRVVLVDFWTFSCINWLRTLPYVRAWAQKYGNAGLVVIGVHSPEFQFEKNVDDVRRVTRERGIDYPVAIDSDFAVWRAFDNNYWPALYFADAQGAIRDHHFGEGRYEESERVIQQLLREAGAGGVDDDLVSVRGSGDEAPADWSNVKSPETYVGSARAERRVDASPAQLRLGQWALTGEWTIGREDALLNEAGGGIAYRFHARDLHLVMGPAARGSSVRFRVLVDGEPPGAAHGLDVDEIGNRAVSEPRLHQLIRQPGTVGEHTFEIAFLDPGVQAYVFTFG